MIPTRYMVCDLNPYTPVCKLRDVEELEATLEAKDARIKDLEQANEKLLYAINAIEQGLLLLGESLALNGGQGNG